MFYKMRREFVSTFDSFCSTLQEVQNGNRNCVPIEIVQSLCQKALENNNHWDAERIALAAIKNSSLIEYFDEKLLINYISTNGNLQDVISSNGNGH